ncbi:aminotransferase [Mycobacterium asiaticum]|uniref:Aminotransferase n=1 Tax=Mycobacterium asiaticum TaxID=1790 RepID=A0A1A3NS16_MYCAS|nr:aminotransferase class I/II-fold pyridoxal phosphate-dependent enzyme [Mycobacterium asiaticum]OBK24165.1 aminotransferase [Mycobacterium asiaticum]
MGGFLTVTTNNVCLTAPYSTRHELSLSENPFPPLPSVRDAIDEAMARANRYPEFLPHRVEQLIASHIGVESDQVVVGAGATGVAMQIIDSVTRRGDEMIYATPTFDGYSIISRIVGAASVTVPLDALGRQDLAAMAAAQTNQTGVIVVCRPHNPTGTLVDGPELEEFLTAVSRQVTVILDEAYVEFLDHADLIDVRSITTRHPNVLVLRTFSKAYGLAGLRIGYAFGAADLAARIRARQVPFALSVAAESAVLASYRAEDELAARVKTIVEDRDELRDALIAGGIPVPRSYANFLYLPHTHVAEMLSGANIGVKAYQDGSARLAIGDRSARHAVLRALRIA